MSDGLSLLEAKAYIEKIDFNMVIKKMVSEQGWLQEDAENLCGLYRHYLFLHKKYGKNHTLPPSEEIDEFWHNHILDTRKYIKDCEIIFGSYLHHYPYFGIDEKTTFNDLENAFAKTQELHKQEFGDYIYEIQNIYSKLIGFFKQKFKKKPNRYNNS